MENIQYQFIISGLINGLVNLIVLIACIILFSKKRTPATILLLVGGILCFISFFGSIFYNIWAAQQGSIAVINTQVAVSFFQGFAFFVFGIGLLLLAVNDFKK